MKGLITYVFKNPLGDCTAGGITSKKESLILVDESINAPFEVKEGEPYLEIRYKEIGGEKYIYAVPKNVNDFGNGMFGGNFIYTSDSRFPSKQPIPVHDRFEI